MSGLVSQCRLELLPGYRKWSVQFTYYPLLGILVSLSKIHSRSCHCPRFLDLFRNAPCSPPSPLPLIQLSFPVLKNRRDEVMGRMERDSTVRHRTLLKDCLWNKTQTHANFQWIWLFVKFVDSFSLLSLLLKFFIEFKVQTFYFSVPNFLFMSWCHLPLLGPSLSSFITLDLSCSLTII